MLSAKERRELYKKESAVRHQESYNEKDDSGRFRDIFEPSKKSGVKFWKCKEDDHDIYIVPFISGSQHPKLPEGKLAFNLYPFVHRGVGVNEDSFICLNRTYGERCPICEYQKELRESDNDVDDATIKALNPTKRALYNVVCMDSPKDEALGIQVWDVSHWLFTIPLEELAHKKKGGGDVLYADFQVGKIISFRKKGSKRSTEFTAFEFKDREPLTDEIMEAAVCIDELLHKPTYEEVSDSFWAGKDGESAPKEEEDTPSRREKQSDPDPEPPKKTLAKKLPVKQDVPESVSKFTDCPNGAAFGKDFNQYEECRPCEARKDCRAKLDEIEAEKAPAQTERKKLTRRDK